jgi:hypothetical protein
MKGKNSEVSSPFFFILNFTLYIIQISDSKLETPTQFYTFHHKNSSELLLQPIYMLHTNINWGPDMYQLSRSAPNVRCSDRDAFDQVIMILYFCSINIFFDASP